MDIQKAREAFERRQAKVLNMPYKELKARFDENFRLFGARYNIGSINEKEWNLWLEAWQAAKAQAVPEGFVLVPLDVVERCMSHICLAMCHQNNSNSENDVMQMDLEILESELEAQEPAND